MGLTIKVLISTLITVLKQSIKPKEVHMDKANHNAESTSIGAAMKKATEAKDADVTTETETKVPKKAKVEEFILDIPEDEKSLDYEGIKIYGSGLISTKFLSVVKHLISSDEFQKEQLLESIVFSENQPVDKDGTPIYACYKPELKRIGINLQQHFDGAEVLVKEIDGFMSMRGHIWYNMLLSVLHELYHGIFISTDKEAEMDMSELEEACNEMADEALTALAREFDVEPAAMAEEPFFGSRYMQFFIREIQKGEGDWCVRQLALHDDLHIHYDDKTKDYIEKFRTFIRFTHGGDMEQKDPRWDAKVKPLNIIFQDAAEIEAQVIVPEVVSETAGVDAKPVASSLIGGHGVDEEALAMSEMDDELRGDSNAYVMDDYDTLPPEAVGFNMQHGAPVERVQKTHVAVDANIQAAANAKKVPSAPPDSPEAIVAPHLKNTQLWCPNHLDMFTSDETYKLCGICGEALTSWTPPKAEAAPAGAQPPLKTVAGAPPPNANAFCTNCGEKRGAGMPFCGGCGSAAAEAGAAKIEIFPQPQPHRGAPGQQLQTGLTNHNWEVSRFRSIVESILFRAYTHLFNKCGYSIMANPAFDNNQKWAVLEPVYVGDLPDVDRVLIGHDIFENNLNRINIPITDGHIRGFVTKGGMLPCYTLYFNANGDEIKRVLLPTNPWKEKAGAYSPPALRAQQGAIIAWIMDGDDNTVNKWRGRIEDSIFIWS